MNRRATLGEMSASIAHEIKQPLSSIVLNSDAVLKWLSKQQPNIKEASTAAKSIASEAHRANRIVESVRAMFKKESQAKVLVDINEVVKDVLVVEQIELQEHAVSTKCTLTDSLFVLGDKSQLQQVVLNLVRNAIEAMSSVLDRPRVLQIRSEAMGDHEIIVTIADSGPGLNSEMTNRVFEPFFTTKDTGMGMGLSICRPLLNLTAESSRLTHLTHMEPSSRSPFRGNPIGKAAPIRESPLFTQSGHSTTSRVGPWSNSVTTGLCLLV
jgi:C4-dicarboxylate-specific signal transduction histidine kinase